MVLTNLFSLTMVNDTVTLVVVAGGGGRANFRVVGRKQRLPQLLLIRNGITGTCCNARYSGIRRNGLGPVIVVLNKHAGSDPEAF